MAVADGIAVEHHAAGVRLDQAHQQPRGGGFAAAGFADDAEGLALADGERHVVHRLHGGDLAVQQSAAHRKMLAQTFDKQQRLCRAAAIAGIAQHRCVPSSRFTTKARSHEAAYGDRAHSLVTVPCGASLHLFSLTSIALRNPSLIRLKHIEVMKIIAPGSAAT